MTFAWEYDIYYMYLFSVVFMRKTWNSSYDLSYYLVTVCEIERFSMNHRGKGCGKRFSKDLLW